MNKRSIIKMSSILAGLLFAGATASAQVVLYSDNFNSLVTAGTDFTSGAGAYSYGYDADGATAAIKVIDFDTWARQGTNSSAVDVDLDGDLELKPNNDGANNVKLWGIILDPTHFSGYGGQTLTISMDLIGADAGVTKIFLSSANSFDGSGSNDLVMDVAQGGFGTYVQATGTGNTSITPLITYDIPDETASAAWSQDFAYTEGDALILTFGSYNSAYAFDNLAITAVPEPATFALLAGFATLGLVMYRRRRS